MSAQHYYPFDLGLPALGHSRKCSRVTREIRSVCNRASAFHVNLLKCQFVNNGVIHSDSEKEENGTNKTHVFADFDYAADESRRSTMGGIIIQNGGPISWFSGLGKTVALSTCEAEFNLI